MLPGAFRFRPAGGLLVMAQRAAGTGPKSVWHDLGPPDLKRAVVKRVSIFVAKTWNWAFASVQLVRSHDEANRL